MLTGLRDEAEFEDFINPLRNLLRFGFGTTIFQINWWCEWVEVTQEKTNVARSCWYNQE